MVLAASTSRLSKLCLTGLFGVLGSSACVGDSNFIGQKVSDDFGGSEGFLDEFEEGDELGSSVLEGAIGEAEDAIEWRLADGISISLIEVNQGVSIPVMQDGQEIPIEERGASLIEGRPALVRVHWEVDEDWEPKVIRGVLHYSKTNEADPELGSPWIEQKLIEGHSNGETLGGTFSWPLPLEDVHSKMRYSVRLYEEGKARPNPAASDNYSNVASTYSAGSSFPTGGDSLISLGVDDELMVLKIVLVPIIDKSVSNIYRLDSQLLEEIKEQLYQLNPVQEVEVRLRTAPVTTDILEWGEGQEDWTEKLNELREADGVSADVHYHGVVMHRDSDEFWSSNSSTSIAGAGGSGASETDLASSSLSVMEVDPTATALNVARGIARSHGLGRVVGNREQATCEGPASAAEIDSMFPYSAGRVGVQGYGVLDKKLRSASSVDYMTYCNSSNNWVSDYHWSRSAEAIRLRSAAADVQVH